MAIIKRNPRIWFAMNGSAVFFALLIFAFVPLPSSADDQPFDSGIVAISETSNRTNRAGDLTWLAENRFVTVADYSIGAESGVYIRFFSGDGETLGDEILVTQDEIEFQAASVVWNGTEILVLWKRIENFGTSVELWSRLYDAEGAPIGPALQVNETPASYVFYVRAVPVDSDTFWVSWVSGFNTERYYYEHIRWRAVSTPNGPSGEEKALVTSGNNNLFGPFPVATESGDILMTWGLGQVSELSQIILQQWNSGAEPISDPIVLNSDMANFSIPETATVRLEDGFFIVVWRSIVRGQYGDEDFSCLNWQRFEDDGSAAGSTVILSSRGSNTLESMDGDTSVPSGSATVAWEERWGYESDDDSDDDSDKSTHGSTVLAVRLGAMAEAIEGPIGIDLGDECDEHSPRVAMNESGRIALAWSAHREGYYTKALVRVMDELNLENLSDEPCFGGIDADDDTDDDTVDDDTDDDADDDDASDDGGGDDDDDDDGCGC